MASSAYDEPAPSSTPSDNPELDAKASRLLKSAQRASDAAKRAYALGIETTQVRMRQVSEVVLDNAQRAKGSSKEFLSKVAVKAGHYKEKAQRKAYAYKDNVDRAIQQSRDGEGEKLGFPLSLMVWCSTLCGRSKKSITSTDREMAPQESTGVGDDTEGEDFSAEYLANAADEYAAVLEEDAGKLEEAVADRQKKNIVTEDA